MVVILSGLAHLNFSDIHNFLENDKLTIVSKTPWIHQSKEPKVENVETRLQIVGDQTSDVRKLVENGVREINKKFPNSARIGE